MPDAITSEPSLQYYGGMRLHFNRMHSDRPWAISLENGWEVTVRSLLTVDVGTSWTYVPKDVPDDEDGNPSAWVETWGHLQVDDDGRATISP